MHAGTVDTIQRRFCSVRARRHDARILRRICCRHWCTPAAAEAGCLDWTRYDETPALRLQDRHPRNPDPDGCIASTAAPSLRRGTRRRSSCTPAHSRSTPRCSGPAAGSTCRGHRGEWKSSLALSSPFSVAGWSGSNGALSQLFLPETEGAAVRRHPLC